MDVILFLDSAVYASLKAIQSPWLNTIVGLLTHLGDEPVLLGVALTCGVVLLRRKRRRAAVLLLLAAVLGIGLVQGVKELVQRPRPEYVPSLLDRSHPAYSYPSGHGFNTTTVCLTAALLLGGRRWLIAAVALAVLIGLTRLYLGVHWLSDVVGGWVGGVGWALLWVWFDRPPDRASPSLSDR